MSQVRLAALLFLQVWPACAIDNGKGATPPMGWRSWNLYGGNVNQQLIEGIMDGMASKNRTVGGVPTSLCDLGYCDVGLDDNWQLCAEKGAGSQYSYHDDAGFPTVNEARFPDMKAMTNRAHRLGLTAGWYHNNCICAEHRCGTGVYHGETDSRCYEGDVAALIELGFDSVKLDNCGSMKDLDLWAGLMNASGRPILIENCHWGDTTPNETWCPWNTFRTSGDVRASYGSIVRNLQTTVQWAISGLSRPGCWAYPDMLEVGCKHGPGGPSDPGLTPPETRSHFGSWAIVSSPLVLSYDVNDPAIADAVWHVVSNRDAIRVNRAWAGLSGAPFAQAEETVVHTWIEPLSSSGAPTRGLELATSSRKEQALAPRWQYFYKPLAPAGASTAVLLMNHDAKAADLTVAFADVPGVTCSACKVYDIWSQQPLGVFTVSFTAKALEAHDSAFLIITPAEGVGLAGEEVA